MTATATLARKSADVESREIMTANALDAAYGAHTPFAVTVPLAHVWPEYAPEEPVGSTTVICILADELAELIVAGVEVVSYITISHCQYGQDQYGRSHVCGDCDWD